jgi:hypothetical protein
LGTNSFLVKGWAVTVSGAFLGFAIGGKEWALGVARLLPVALFWLLDAYFLRAERLFRALHDAVRTLDSTVPPFFMAATRHEFGADTRNESSFPAVFFSWTLSVSYGALVIAALIVIAAVGIS